MRADLHLHTVHSDGKYTPTELAKKVKAQGIELFAVTDHDSMGGCDEAREAAISLGLHFVRGWEVSAYNGTCKVHVLGYGCRADDAYNEFLKERFEGAKVRAATIIALANEHFHLDVTMEEVESYHLRKFSPLHTMHIVSAFARRLSRKRGELYDEAFAPGEVAFSEECRPSPEDAIEIIHRTGGIAVLAHPGRILDLEMQDVYRLRNANGVEKVALLEKAFANREKLMRHLVEKGLDGIECSYTTHTLEETEYFSAFADGYGLLKTGGSDFHAEGARPIIGEPRFDADELIERLLRFEGSV